MEIKNKSKPLPELLKPLKTGHWVKEECQEGGYVDLSEHKIVTPHTTDAYGVAVKAHESGHVMFSPPKSVLKRIKRLTPKMLKSIEILEDCRVNALLSRKGVDVGGLVRDDINDIISQPLTPLTTPTERFNNALRCIYLLTLCEEGTAETYAKVSPVTQRSASLMTYSEQEAINNIVRSLLKLPTFDNVKKLSRKLADMYEEPQQNNNGKQVGKQILSKSSDRATWLPVTLVGEEMKPFVTSRHKTVSDMGYLPTHIHRFAVDRRIFSYIRREKLPPKVAILMDMSGSMRVSQSLLQEIASDFKESVVILGYHTLGEEDKKITGTLKYLVKDGNITKNIKCGGINGCDFPALDLVCKKYRPQGYKIILITDEQYNGKGGFVNQKMLDDMQTLIIRNNVAVINTIKIRDKKEICAMIKRIAYKQY